MKKFFFRLKILAIFCLAILAFFPGKLQAQNFETDISISPEVKRLNEIESDLNERLAKLLQNLQTIANFTKKGQYTQARRQLLEVKKNIDQAQRNLAEQKSLGALEKFLYQIEGDLRKSNRALMKSNKDEALTHLTQAYRRTQALEDAGRPVLKISAAELALSRAGQLIGTGDYQNAALYLEQAVNYITEIQSAGPVNIPELSQLKSDIIVTHQQVVLGKLQDEKALGRFVPGLEAARYNTINSYYDIWSRSDEPWRYSF